MVGKESRVLRQKGGLWFRCITIFFLLAGTGALQGTEALNVPGALILETAGKYTHFDGTMKVTGEGIEIHCQKKIFRPYNDFDKPRTEKIFVAARELWKIELIENKVVIYTGDDFYSMYRNYFVDILRGIFIEGYNHVMIFQLEKNTQFDVQRLKRLLKSLKVTDFTG